MQRQVIINDVGPRDGLQNQAKILSAQERLQLIEALVEAGLPAIEIGSFVSPRAVPAMANTDKLLADLPKGEVKYSALIPNKKGYELAREAGVNNVALVVAVSNTFNERNINTTTQRALAVCEELVELSKADGLNIIVYLATSWECPFEGDIAEQAVIELAAQLFSVGASEVVISDTIGAANPLEVKSLMDKLVAIHGADRLACHFHDTRAMGLANVYAATQAGIRKFDASVGGLGGCPFAPGASGNVATEDVVMMLEQMGYHTGVNLAKLMFASDLAGKLTGSCAGGRAKAWLEKQFAVDERTL